MGEWIKSEIYTKANNIAMLSVIQEIGFHFQKELPGYALELASSYELLHFDIQRHLLYHPSPIQTLLKKQILQTVGVPNIEDRYTLDPLCDCNLQEYVIKLQLSESDGIRKKAIELPLVIKLLSNLLKQENKNNISLLVQLKAIHSLIKFQMLVH